MWAQKGERLTILVWTVFVFSTVHRHVLQRGFVLVLLHPWSALSDTDSLWNCLCLTELHGLAVIRDSSKLTAVKGCAFLSRHEENN